MAMKKKDSDIKTINQREKTIGFFYVLILFGLTTMLCSFILFFSNTNYQLSGSKRHALEQMERVKRFELSQIEIEDKIKQVDEKINRLDPGLNASYEKREINYLLGEIREIYLRYKWDERYRVFDHVATFNEFRMSDKERLWNIKKNIEKFKADLERCRNNTENKKNNLKQK